MGRYPDDEASLGLSDELVSMFDVNRTDAHKANLLYGSSGQTSCCIPCTNGEYASGGLEQFYARSAVNQNNMLMENANASRIPYAITYSQNGAFGLSNMNTNAFDGETVAAQQIPLPTISTAFPGMINFNSAVVQPVMILNRT